MLSAIAPGSTIRPVANDSPAMVKSDCSGRRSMLRMAMRNVGVKCFASPSRSISDGL